MDQYGAVMVSAFKKRSRQRRNQSVLQRLTWAIALAASVMAGAVAGGSSEAMRFLDAAEWRMVSARELTPEMQRLLDQDYLWQATRVSIAAGIGAVATGAGMLAILATFAPLTAVDAERRRRITAEELERLSQKAIMSTGANGAGYSADLLTAIAQVEVELET